MSKNNTLFNRTMDVREVLDLAQGGFLDKKIDDFLAAHTKREKVRHFDDM